MIKAVIFDIDGVLLDSFEANFKFFQELLTEAGYNTPSREEFAPIFHLTMFDVIKILTKSTSEKEIKRIWEMGRGNKINHHMGLLEIPKKAEATIRSLSKNYILGIATSRIREGIYRIPQLIKLKKYFKVAVSYQDTANHKPHPEPLLFAAKKLGVKPKECVYIGDVENDFKAAKAAKMKVIIYSKIQFDRADAYTSSFNKLPELIVAL